MDAIPALLQTRLNQTYMLCSLHHERILPRNTCPEIVFVKKIRKMKQEIDNHDLFWKLDIADQVGVLIDGEQYYSAFADLILQARHQVFILCWDVDSRTALLRPCDEEHKPCTLVDVLLNALDRNPGLHIYLLAWDYSMIYAFEREWRPLFSQKMCQHERLHVHYDDQHPIGACHHQKALIVDDKTALVGGFDPSKWRWDSSCHRPNDERRLDPSNKPYPPFHDLALAVSGEPACHVGSLARQRWALATNERIDPPPREYNVQAPWPQDLPILLRQAEIGLARTLPHFCEQTEVREIEQALCHAIDHANKFIYIENQYFTSHRIGQALIDKLGAEEGPQIVMILPRAKDGWLERMTMDVLRARLVQRLRAADRYDRLRLFYPAVRDLEPEMVSVHSKLVIADNTHLNVGSANLSNRSMGLDTELNLSLLGKTEESRAAIDHIRRQLLAEHLDCDVDTIARAENEAGSLISAIERLNMAAADNNKKRWLEPLQITLDDDVIRQIPDAAVIDPERALPPDQLIDLFIEQEHRRPISKRALGFALLIALMAGLALALRFTPLSEIINLDQIAGQFESLRSSFWGGIIALLLFIAASALGVPITPLIVATGFLFGAWAGFGIAYTGAVLSALIGFIVGQYLGTGAMRRLAGSRLDRISKRLARRGILTVFSMRLLPVAPFALINLVAGASHLRLRDFAIGSLAGLFPGTFALTVFSDRLLETIRHPSLISVIVLIAISLLFISIGWGLSRWLNLREQSSST